MQQFKFCLVEMLHDVSLFACQFDNNSFALLLFEGMYHSNSKNKIISLQRATLGAGLQNRTPTSYARSWYEMS
jgi:hypothetical protein